MMLNSIILQYLFILGIQIMMLFNQSIMNKL